MTMSIILLSLICIGLVTIVVCYGQNMERKANGENVRAQSPIEKKGASLSLTDIVKVYGEGDTSVTALKGVSINFRRSEFVSILGQSGCGKTTLLNIIGGLDRYTSGDLVINGITTKEYSDRDWDSYRNHSIGFVFQSYNLIPHQTVLENVEIALAISGVSKRDRRKRATEALVKVGLKDQLHKKPSEMSGGQMQRVAIARALVNNPDVVLADEPTGALDTETSVQIMDILKEISKDRLVVMVTHNPDLAKEYSSRIIRMLDGKIVGDTNPYEGEQVEIVKKTKKERAREKKPSMSLFTAFKLSLKNLFTKKGRTALTSFAGSIGIIGISLILAVSQGTTGYINHVQESTLSAYPLTLQETTIDLSSLMKSFMNVGVEDAKHDLDAVYKEAIIDELVNALSETEVNQNDLKSFKSHLETQLKKEGSEISKAVSGVQYGYDLELAVYTENIDGNIVKSDTNELLVKMLSDYMFKVSANGGSSTNKPSTDSSSQSSMFMPMMQSNMWQELLPATDGSPINKLVKEQYELVHGDWPNEKDEIVLVVNDNNELDDLTLFALGLISQQEIDAIIDAAASGEKLEQSVKKWTYKEICELEFRTIIPSSRYEKIGDVYTDISKSDAGLQLLYPSAFSLKVAGIIRPAKDADAQIMTGSIGYTNMLTKYVIEQAKTAEVVLAQQNSPSTDVLTGLPFKENRGNLTDEQKQTALLSHISTLSVNKKSDLYLKVKSVMSQEDLMAKTMEFMSSSDYQNRDYLETYIANGLAMQMDGLTADEIKAQFLASVETADLQKLAIGIKQQEFKVMYAMQVNAQLSSLSPEQKASALDSESGSWTKEQCAIYYDEVMEFSNSSYQENMKMFGCLDIESPSAINIYASSFENKDVIEAFIEDYNKTVQDENSKIRYTDYVGLMMSSVTQIIDAVTYVLIAFVAISLVVSSIMIGVITLISVQERTKEIGILRAIGASKANVSSMFNAETIIIGFISGVLGVGVTYLLCIPINLILQALTGLSTLKAVLPIPAAIILIVISMCLTLFSGIIPSRSASKKDPVVALRTE